MTTFSFIINWHIILIFLPPDGNAVQVIDTEPERSAEVKRMAEFFLNHFEIENQKVVIFMSPGMHGKCRASLVEALYDAHGNLGFTRINVDNRLKGFPLARVIGHEIYHIKQMADKRLYFKNNRSIVKWKGKIIYNIKAIPYEERPWKEECIGQEFAFANAYSGFRKKAPEKIDFKGPEKTKIVSAEGP